MLLENEMKENKNTRFKSALVGKNSLINSFGIITPENPMGKKSDAHSNAMQREKFEIDLKKFRYDYIPIVGKYGSIEKSYFIINVNEEDLNYLANKYNQKAYIYAIKRWEKDYSDSYMDFYYFEKENNSKYILKDAQDHIKRDEEADDFFTSLKSFKFNIPFPIFEQCMREALILVENKYLHVDKNILIEGIISNISDNELTIKERWHRRCFLYESLEDKIIRFKKLKESANKHTELKKYLPEELYELEKKGLI